MTALLTGAARYWPPIEKVNESSNGEKTSMLILHFPCRATIHIELIFMAGRRRNDFSAVGFAIHGHDSLRAFLAPACARYFMFPTLAALTSAFRHFIHAYIALRIANASSMYGWIIMLIHDTTVLKRDATATTTIFYY